MPFPRRRPSTARRPRSVVGTTGYLGKFLGDFRSPRADIKHSAPTAGSSQEPPCWHPREEQSGPRRAFARPAPPVPANNGRAAQRRRQEAERACCPSSASTEAEQRIFQPMAALRVPVLGRSEPCSGPCTTVQLTAQRPGCSIGTPMRHRADGMEAQGHSADGHRRGRAAARESGHPSEPYCQCRIEGD